MSIAFAGSLDAQCTLAITPGSPTVCVGDSVTLSATVTPPVSASAIPTTLAAGNNHRGNMFDIVAINTVTITSFDAHPMGNTTIEIYYRAGSYTGFATSSTGWTLVGSAAVTAQPMGTPTPVPVAVNVTIPAGQTYAFYITSNNIAVSLNYTDGSTEGATYVSDGNIDFKQGVGMEYPFSAGGGVFTPRIWNGVIHYTTPLPAPVYTYSWNTTETAPTITPVVNANTQYTLTATATGCPTMYDTVNVAVSIPVVTAGSDVTVCQGMQATLTATGTTSFAWDNGVINAAPFTPTATMDYVVTGTDTIGCTDTDTLTVTVNPLPAVTGGTDMGVCEGNVATLSGSGAVSYTWDNGIMDGVAFTPAATQTYVVTGVDTNACVNTDTITVTVNPLPTVDAGSDLVLCFGETFTPAGSGAATYAWNNGLTDGATFTAMISLEYVVTGTDANGCTDTDTMDVTVNTVNTATTNSGTLITADEAAGTYQWIDCGTSMPLAGEMAQSYSATANGNYAVVITDINGCVDTSSCVAVTTTGLADATANTVSVSAYPNPNSGSFVIKSNAGGIYRIVNELGQIVQTIQLNAANDFSWSIDNLNNGVYFISGFSEKAAFSKKIIVAK